MPDYWIKLYHEILDDPKMGTLPDRLWRRTVELFLLAGRLNGGEKTGALPDTRQLAWMLRMTSDDLELDLQQIASTGIIEKGVNGWQVVNFAARQNAATSTERVRAHRLRKQQKQYYSNETPDNVTETKRIVTQKQKQNITEAEEGTAAPIFSDDATAESIYVRVTGTLGIPVSQKDTAIDAIRSIRAQKMDDNETVVYLQTFWRDWRARKYSPANVGWLDWALAGEAPERKAPAKVTKTRTLIDPNGNSIEVPE